MLLKVYHHIPFLRVGDTDDDDEMAAPALADVMPMIEKSHGRRAAKYIYDKVDQTDPTLRGLAAFPAIKSSEGLNEILLDSEDDFSYAQDSTHTVPVTSGLEARDQQTHAISKDKIHMYEDEPGVYLALPGEELPDGEPPPSPPPAAHPEGEDEAELPEMPLVEEGIGDVDIRVDHRALAKTTFHLLTHLPKNPYCQGCQVSKTSNLYTKRGAFRQKRQAAIKGFGDLVTCDQMIMKAVRQRGCCGEANAFIVKDIATGFLGTYPVLTKSADGVLASLMDYVP